MEGSPVTQYAIKDPDNENELRVINWKTVSTLPETEVGTIS